MANSSKPKDEQAAKAKKAAPAKKSSPAKPARQAKTAQAADKVNWFEQAAQFMREVKTELKKVNWPSRKQTVSSTAVVVVLVVIISVFLGAVDFVLSHAIRMLIG